MSKLVGITLDESTIIRWNEDIEKERLIAIHDLLQDNSFIPQCLEEPSAGPYVLHLLIKNERIEFQITDENNKKLGTFTLATSSFKRIINEYLSLCGTYYKTVKSTAPHAIETIDMGRRSIHNNGSEILRDLLSGKAEIDFLTARRLFTLICVLHLKG